MDGEKSVCIHPDPNIEEFKEVQEKPSRIPLPVHDAWSSKNLKGHSKNRSPTHRGSASAPASPSRHKSRIPTPTSSPGHSLPSEKATATKKIPSPTTDECKSMPSMPQKDTSRILQPKTRYNMHMESPSLIASTVSSEFSSTIDFENSTHESPDYSVTKGRLSGFQEKDSNITTPSMLYPKQDAVVDPNDKEETDSILSFSIVSIPSKVSISSINDDDMSSATITPIYSSPSLMNVEDVDKLKLSAQNSELFEAGIELLNEDNEAVQKALQEAHANIQFLEDENHTLKEKTTSDALEISKLKLSVEEEKQALQKHFMEVKKQNKELNTKLLSIEEEHSLCNRQMKLISSSKNDTDKQLMSMRTDLIASQEKIKHLEELTMTLRNEKQRCEGSLEFEKGRAGDLQSSLDSTSSQMATITKQLEDLHEESKRMKTALLTKEGEMGKLGKDLKHMKKEKTVALAKIENLDTDKAMLLNELEQVKLSLAEAREQHKSSQLRVREMGKKLSAVECKEKESATNLSSEEMKFQMVNKENQELKVQLQRFEERMTMREKEFQSIVLEKQIVDDKVTEMENLVKKNEDSKAQEMLFVSNETAKAKAQNKIIQEELTEKEKRIRSLERQHTNAHCSLESEREQKNTLALKVTTLEGELSTLKNQYRKLEAQRQEFTEETERKFIGLKDSENALMTQMKEKANAFKQKDDELHTTVIKLRQAETELEKLKGKAIELETEVALSHADVENHKKLCDNLQSKLQLIQDSKHQEISQLKAQLDSKRLEVSKLSTRLDSLHMEKENVKIALEKSSEALDHEKIVLTSLQSELAKAETNGDDLSSHIDDLDEQIKSLSSQKCKLQVNLEDAEMKINHRTEEVDLLKRKLKEVMAKGEEDESNLQEEMEKVIHERNVSKSNLHKLNEVLKITQEKLESVQSEYEITRVELNRQKEESNSIQISMETEAASRNELAKMYATLESQYAESQSLLRDLENQLNIAKEQNESLKNQIKVAEHQCSSLQREIGMVEEAKVKNEEKMDERLNEVLSRHQKDCSEAKQAHDELQATVDKLSEESSNLKFECASLKARLEKGNVLNHQQKKTIAENKAKDLLQLKKISELEMHLAEENEAKMTTKRELAMQLSKEHDLQVQLDEVQHKLCSSMVREDSLCTQLQQEKLKIIALQKEMEEAEAEIRKKTNALLKQKEYATELKLMSESELSQLKHKYHSDVKALKEKAKDLQAEIHLLKSSCSSKSSTIDKIQASYDDLERTNSFIQSQLDKMKREWEEKSELLKSSQIRNQSLDIQLTQLQLEVATLSKSQLEFEDYKKRIESASREELQRVLKEVTQHMEEQHTSHHYLEKLRKENEAIALKEKDRQIDHMRNQLKRKKQELKKDRLHIESLEIESRFLKSQHKDSTHARHKIENHLEKISDALGVTASSSFSTSISSAPHASSTPIANRNKSFQ